MSHLETYQELMRRSRGISVIGAAIMLSLAGVEVAHVLWAVSVSEVDVLSDPTLRWYVGFQLALLVLVLVGFSIRIVVLTQGERAYTRFSTSWLFAFVTALLYASIVFEPASPAQIQCVSEGGKICFGIYTTTRDAPLLQKCAFLMPFVSGLRSAITFAIAARTSKYR